MLLFVRLNGVYPDFIQNAPETGQMGPSIQTPWAQDMFANPADF